jgi:hypothetical protein
VHTGVEMSGIIITLLQIGSAAPDRSGSRAIWSVVRKNLVSMPQNIKISSMLFSLLLARCARENATKGASRGSCRGGRLKE